MYAISSCDINICIRYDNILYRIDGCFLCFEIMVLLCWTVASGCHHPPVQHHATPVNKAEGFIHRIQSVISNIASRVDFWADSQYEITSNTR